MIRLLPDKQGTARMGRMEANVDQYIHFEALLVKKDGWKMVMAYQKALATEEEWEAAR